MDESVSKPAHAIPAAFKDGLPPPRMLRFLVPALNESENLPQMIRELAEQVALLEYPWQLLIVDDGSTDQTVQVIQELGRTLPVRVISHAQNLGPGAAFLTGFLALLPECGPNDLIITLEADNTSDIRILPEMLRHAHYGTDVVLASVYHPLGGFRNTPAHRKVLSLVANSLIQNAFHLENVYTFSSFYRIYRAGMLKRALEHYGRQMMAEPGFASVVELLIKLHRLGAHLKEVPMVLDTARRKGASRMKIFKTARAYGRLVVRLNLEPPPPRTV